MVAIPPPVVWWLETVLWPVQGSPEPSCGKASRSLVFFCPSLLVTQPHCCWWPSGNCPSAGHRCLRGYCYCYHHFSLWGGDTVLSFAIQARK